MSVMELPIMIVRAASPPARAIVERKIRGSGFCTPNVSEPQMAANLSLSSSASISRFDSSLRAIVRRPVTIRRCLPSPLELLRIAALRALPNRGRVLRSSPHLPHRAALPDRRERTARGPGSRIFVPTSGECVAKLGQWVSDRQKWAIIESARAVS
jgi:hypothetical protein